MKTVEEPEEVWYPASTFVWCKGESKLLGRHPLFVSSPVRFTRSQAQRFTMLTCSHCSCSLHGQSTRYSEEELGFQNGYVFRNSCPQSQVKQ
jgi:hypothetical protein